MLTKAYILDTDSIKTEQKKRSAEHPIHYKRRMEQLDKDIDDLIRLTQAYDDNFERLMAAPKHEKEAYRKIEARLNNQTKKIKERLRFYPR